MFMMITYASWQTVIDMAMVKVMCYPTEMTTPCRPPVTVIHLTRLGDNLQSSSQLLDDGWWMDDKNMMGAVQSMSLASAIII